MTRRGLLALSESKIFFTCFVDGAARPGTEVRGIGVEPVARPGNRSISGAEWRWSERARL
ncbi:hypothetical protein GCM10012287_56550 [Streptomyces daqingensis]|uniref:Uncharacterized protein n=1 Tax=Streptomyces daqingensis TaxID=1472640 RepID=A0ABQ2MU85_9ACTN|nr:hypothetical protein GCM10012287_56550 [Streptomyces daqingensis]